MVTDGLCDLLQCPLRGSYSKNLKRWEDGKTETLPDTAGGAVGWASHCGKPVWPFLEKLNAELPCDLAILPLGICPRGMNTGCTKTGTQTFTGVLFTVARK